MLQQHCSFNAKSDALSGFPPEDCHRELTGQELKYYAHQDPDRWEIKDHCARNYLEVIVIVEGIEPTTSSTLQARHSYIVGGPGDSDVAWDMEFAECCRLPQGDGRRGLGLDLARFHDLVPVGQRGPGRERRA